MYYIGIDLGGTQVKLGFVKDGKISGRSNFTAKSAHGLAAQLRELEDEIDRLLTSTQTDGSTFGGIGLAFPGLVDVQNRRALSTNAKYDDAPHIDLVGWAKNKWGVSLFIDNDARMATVGEWQYGTGKGYDNLVMMTLGTGIGTSVIMEGRVIRGKHFQAGCLGGHITVKLDGPPCNCGNTGCVEALSSSWSIAQKAPSMDGFAQSRLSKAEKIDFLELFDAAREGDRMAGEMKEACLHAWSAGAVNLIHAYDPEMIIMGGGVMNSRDEILPYIRQYVRQNAWTPWGSVRIEASSLMNDAAILGVCYCLEKEV